MAGAGNRGVCSGLAFGIVLVLCGQALAQGGVTWTQLSPATSPSVRTEPAMAYDAARQRVVLFGGISLTGSPTDTWEWDGTNWIQRFPTMSPSGSGAMAYDAARQLVVFFGGSSGAATWTWDGQDWTQRFPVMSPSGAGAMAYDLARQRVVLFDGLGTATWTWDGMNWMQHAPTQSPPARQGHAMAYDARRQRVVLFGGFWAGFYQDTWEWDGVSWTQSIPTMSPPRIAWHSMDYDAARQRVVLFGGVSGFFVGGLEGGTWEWNGRTWTDTSPGLNPSPRSGPALAFDAARGCLVLFGGIDDANYQNDTWEYASLSPASFATFGTGCPGTMGNPTLASAHYSLPWTGDTFSVELGNLPSTSFAFMVLGFAQASTPIPALPGCTQLNTANAAELLTLNGNTATWSKTIPVSAGLVGWSLYFQGAALSAGGSNVFGAALSNGGQATIGMR